MCGKGSCIIAAGLLGVPKHFSEPGQHQLIQAGTIQGKFFSRGANKKRGEIAIFNAPGTGEHSAHETGQPHTPPRCNAYDLKDSCCNILSVQFLRLIDGRNIVHAFKYSASSNSNLGDLKSLKLFGSMVSFLKDKEASYGFINASPIKHCAVPDLLCRSIFGLISSFTDRSLNSAP